MFTCETIKARNAKHVSLLPAEIVTTVTILESRTCAAFEKDAAVTRGSSRRRASVAHTIEHGGFATVASGNTTKDALGVGRASPQGIDAAHARCAFIRHHRVVG